jgi:energy-coupling factor transport system substrate-specific component
MTNLSKTKFLTLIVVCAGLNLGIGFIVATIKLPFYLDSIGTVLATMLGGVWAGIACGILAVLVGSAYSPTLWAYAGTAISIAIYVSVVRRGGYLQKPLPTILYGLGLGVVTAIVSAPVTTYIWKGVSLSGADALTAFFSATGETLVNSVVLGGLSTDPIDKLVTSLVVFALVRRLPQKWLAQNPTEEK